MEKKIGTIDDETFGLKNKIMIKPTIRIGARGIVLNDNGEIAIFNKQNKNEFKLPGGGVEAGETPEEGFLREVIEETGCDVKIIKKIGFIIENKTQNNFRQKSYIFVSKVINDRGHLNLTEKENDEGAKLIWTTPENGHKLINDCYKKYLVCDPDHIYHLVIDR